MKDRKQRRKLSGAVLIMILTVMFILIILLMATLTVVTTANQRIYTKFEENQAYYTARSALDIFTQSLLPDGGYYAYETSGSSPREYKYTDSDGNEQTSKMKQGLALEFELYKIRAKNDAGYASNFLKGDNVFGGKPEDANYSSAYDYSGVYDYDPDSTSKLDAITYTVTLPQISSATNTYGKIVDKDSTTGTQKATIKVEVLERHYDYGGNCASAFRNMTDAELKTCSAGSVTYSGVTYTAAQLKDAISKGDRTKDKIRLKVTSNVTFIDTPGTAVLIYDTTEAPKVNSSQAITSMGGVTGSSGTFAIGGASALNDIQTIDGSVLVGNLYVDGNFSMVNSTNKLYFFKDTSYTIRGNWSIDSNSGYNKLDFKENGSVIYVTGTFSLSDDNTFASPSVKANVVADTISISGNGANSGATYNGNFFCNAFQVGDALSPTINGNVYTNYIIADDYAAVGTNSSGADVIRISDSLVFSDKVTVSGGIQIGADKYDFVSATTLQGPDPLIPGSMKTYTLEYGNQGDISGSDAVVPPTNPFVYSSSAVVKMDFNDSSMYTMTSENKKQFILPANLAGVSTNKFEAPTAAFLYSEIFQPDTFVAKATDDGTNGEIDTTKTEYPEFNGVVNTSGVTVDWYGTDMGVQRTDLIDDVVNGTITNSNYWDYGYGWQDWQIDSQIATKARQDAISSDATYQAELAAYYAAYITGAEKANESQADLNVCSSEITLNTIDLSAGAADTELKTIATDIGATKVVNSNGYLKINESGYGSGSKTNIKNNAASPVIIDARNAPITLQLGTGSGSGTFRGYFVVIGEQPVKVYLPDGIDDYSLGNTASGQGFFMSTYDIYKEMGSTGTLKLGDDPNAMPSPNIFFYAGDNVDSVTVYSEDSFISGHIYFPFADYTYNVNDGYAFSSVKYNTQAISMGSNAGFHCIGSLICGSYTSGNKTGVAYISQDNNNHNAGEPQFHWLTYEYRRS